MKRIGLLLILLFALISNTLAVDAYPYLIQFRQPDKKTVVAIYMKGDEKIHWAETEDGYSLVTNDDGYFVYATLDNEGNMMPSKYIATNIEERSSEVVSFLSHTQKKLCFSETQISAMLSVWKLTEEQEKMKYSGDVLGEKRILVILMGFKDRHFSVATTFVRSMFNQVNYSLNRAYGSVRDFYYENSYGKFILTADVVGPFVADSNMAYYGNNVDGDARELAKEAFIAAAAHVDYSNYDNDNDGILDGAHILFAGAGEEAGAGADCIWSHKWNLYEPLVYNNITISTYSCSPEFQKPEENKLTNIGVICHELGHVFGAPDYYDTDYSGSGGEYPGNGKWDLMSSGSWNAEGAAPAHHNPYTKIYIYRWATPTVLDTQTTVVLNPSSMDSNSFYRINTATPNEYFLLENRQKIGFDKFLPYHGMMVYHIHSNMSYYNINTSHPQKMYPLYAFSMYHYPNSTPSSYGDINSTGCPFPGPYNRKSLTDYTKPWLRDWDSNATNMPINYIMEKDDKVYFKMNGGLPTPLSFSAEAKTDSSIALKWERYDNCRVMVRCSKNNSFTSLADSNYNVGDVLENGDTVIYIGMESGFVHQNLASDEVYYYNVCSKITDTTYSNSLTASGYTYCTAINEYPYIENFDNGISDCWKQENIVGKSYWTVTEHSVLEHVVDNSDSAINRIILTPFDFSNFINAVIKIKLNTSTLANTFGSISLYYKTLNSNEWKYLQSYSPDTHSEVMAVLPQLSEFYLVSLVAEADVISGISIEQIEVETFTDSVLVIAASTNGYGTVSPQGISMYHNGDSIDYTFMPQPGYKLDSVYVDGKTVEVSDNTYTFADIRSSKTVYATFIRNAGINNVENNDNAIAVYPNPAKDKICIYNNTDEKIECKIYDISGRLVYAHDLMPNVQMQVSASKLKNGMYILKCVGSTFEEITKIIINK